MVLDMENRFTVACVQNSALDDVAYNIQDASDLVRQAVGEGADFVCLPEYFTCLEPSDHLYIERGFSEAEHPTLPHFRGLAAELKTWLLLGSIAVKVGEAKVSNRSYLLDSDGEIVESYDKIHLFDVSLKRGESYKESRTVAPGDRACVADLPWGRLGFSVCYDVRFPQLYRSLGRAGADFISIPAAFTATTGAAHWHVLVRSRAIETGCYVFAPNQFGKRPWGRRTYGHSLIVDPWGKVLADAGDRRGFVTAEIDTEQVREARRMIPALTHDRTIAAPE
ncbi:MAG: carbon-nitrogen hydrolase family protein [Gammaproteobacteria bacterium]|jgi:predicted amidohydrolase|nr:carbon-nitrogen hydrolase family protein [Gammaproteobacteria bacterium]